MVRATLFVSAIAALIFTVSASPAPVDLQNNGIGVGVKNILNRLHVHDILNNAKVASGNDLTKAVSGNTVKVLKRGEVPSVYIDRSGAAV